MIDLHERLYEDLLSLTKAEGKAFFFAENTLRDVKYRIFSYRLITNNDQWQLNDSALECRGVTFEMDQNNRPVRLVSWPFEKFFNLNENPMTRDLDLSQPTEILLKEDGSLISSLLLPNAELHLKTKGSLQSDQAKAANELIQRPEWRALYDWTLDWTERGHTVIMEYTSPFNRIVVPYDESALTILAIRNHADGSYVNLFDMELPPEIGKLVVQNLATQVEDSTSFFKSIQGKIGLEGYVVRLASGQRVKIKTQWYTSLHRNHGSKRDLSDLALAKAVLDETMDDLRSMHNRSPEMLARMAAITESVSTIYNDTVEAVTDFFNMFRHLPRRDYALLAKKELSTYQMGLAMQLFVGRKVNFAESVLQHLKKDSIVF